MRKFVERKTPCGPAKTFQELQQIKEDERFFAMNSAIPKGWRVKAEKMVDFIFYCSGHSFEEALKLTLDEVEVLAKHIAVDSYPFNLETVEYGLVKINNCDEIATAFGQMILRFLQERNARDVAKKVARLESGCLAHTSRGLLSAKPRWKKPDLSCILHPLRFKKR